MSISKTSTVYDKRNFLQGVYIRTWFFLGQIIPPVISECSPGYAEIQKLVELLAQEPGVEAVRAIAHQPGSLCEVTVELLSSVGALEQRKLREKAVDLVTEAEWKLLDSTQTKDWYFDAKVTKKFDNNLGWSWLVTSRNAGS